ncbi:DUF1820 family protein [Granulosicoccus sp. 3-233]|uniref:DUF1820 family protein n=1 Tax=Granulosicoccus sp. 3-233 TaxID=3417969 RepID=UPI003D332FEA
MTEDKVLYRVRFISQDKVYEIYAREVYQGDLYGFVVIEQLVFDTNKTVVVDPGEEKLKTEFEGVTQTIIPMHSIIRIDEVEKRGTAKVVELKGNVTQFPSPIYTPGRTPDA